MSRPPQQVDWLQRKVDVLEDEAAREHDQHRWVREQSMLADARAAFITRLVRVVYPGFRR